jgi:hypothetical protein
MQESHVLHNWEKYKEVSFYSFIKLFIHSNLTFPYNYILTLVSTNNGREEEHQPCFMERMVLQRRLVL